MISHNPFCSPYASFTDEQLPLLKVAALWFAISSSFTRSVDRTTGDRPRVLATDNNTDGG